MKNFLAVLSGLCLFCAPLCAQVFGASPEDLDESETEFLEYASRHPLKVNLASRRTLAASGLLTPFQAASIADYRRRSGDILSLAELSFVDGFSPQLAAAIAPYVSFESASSLPAGFSLESSVDADLTLRATVKGGSWDGAALKCGVTVSERMEAAINVRDGRCTGALAIRGRGILDQLVLGDYKLRFGQGLDVWDGLSLSTLSSVSVFARHPTGLSVSHSFPSASVSSGRGGAVSLSYGRFSLVPYFSMAGFRPGAFRPDRYGCHGRFLTDTGEYGTGWSSSGAWTVDFRQYLWRTDFFGEARFGVGSTSFVMGAIINLSYDVKAALRVRMLSGDTAVSSSPDRSVSLGAKLWGTDITADFSYLPLKQGMQTKIYADCPIQPAPWWKVTLRLKERLRTWTDVPSLLDIRLDNEFRACGCLRTVLRCEGTLAEGSWGKLVYLEEGLVLDRLSVWARGVLYAIDDWEERIYVYERDAPQCFNVRAYYRRGFRPSLYIAWKTRSAGNLYFRLSPSESRLQYVCSLGALRAGHRIKASES